MTFRRRNVGTGSSSQDFGGEERISRRSSVLEISWSACSRCSVEENIGGGWSAVERRINDILAVKRSRNVSAENVGRFVDARPPLPRPRRLLKVVQSLFGSLDWWEISVSQYSCSLVRYEECISLTKRTHNALSDEECLVLPLLPLPLLFFSLLPLLFFSLLPLCNHCSMLADYLNTQTPLHLQSPHLALQFPYLLSLLQIPLLLFYLHLFLDQPFEPLY